MTGTPAKNLSLTPHDALILIVHRARQLAAPSDRRIAIGLAGGPGSGKSTLAAEIVTALNLGAPGTAALVPMDGFHMRHAKLEQLGTVKDKGTAHTFEGAAFVEFLTALKAAETAMNGPGYSRKIEDVVEDAFTIAADTKILIVEGNYLLLPDAPWSGVKPLLDLSVFVDVPRDMVRSRLMKRHAEEGLFTEERNREHIERVDLANFDQVRSARDHADLVIDLLTER